MRIDASTAAYRPPFTSVRDVAAEPPVQETLAPRSADTTTVPPVQEPTESGQHRGQRAHGMLRKLQDGHFNPVADLRHRIKFNDEIQEQGLEIPELREPHGNGRAYEKFLEIYRALVPESPAEAPPESEKPVVGEVPTEVPSDDLVSTPVETTAPELPTDAIDAPVDQTESAKPDMTQVFQSLSTYLAQQRIDLIA